MSKLNATVLPAICTDEWLAKTYSEYLYACSEDQIDLNNDIADACSNETLSTYIEQKQGLWDENKAVIDKAINDFCLTNGLLYNDIVNQTEAYQAVMENYHPTQEVLDAATAISVSLPDSYAEASDVIDDIVNGYPNVDDLISEQSDFQLSLDTIAAGVVAARNLDPDYRYPLLDGFVKLKDLVKGVVLHTQLDLSDIDISLPAVDSQDSQISSIVTNYSTIIDELKQAASSNIAWAQGFASCAISNVTDRITNFTESIKASFSSAYTEAKETFNNVRAYLAEANLSVRSFIAQAEQALGWDQIINDHAVLKDTSVGQYTGASPYAGMDLHTAKGIATATVKTLAAAGHAIWEGMKKIGSKIWGKIRPYVKAITNDPEDLKVIDKDASSYQIEGWSFTSGSGSNKFRIKAEGMNERRALENYLISKYKGKTIGIDNYFGSMLITFVNFTDGTGLPVWSIDVEYTYQFKPKCVNAEQAVKCGVLSDTMSDYGLPTVAVTPTYAVPRLTNFVSSGATYYDDDVDEEHFFRGFHTGIILSWWSAILQMWEFALQTSARNGMEPKVGLYHGNDHIEWMDFTSGAPSIDTPSDASLPWRERYGWVSPNSVTNADFLRIASGYVGTHTANEYYSPLSTISEFQYYCGNKQFGPAGSYYYNNNIDIGDIVSLFAHLFVMQANDRRANPGDFVYLPYTTDTWDFDAPHYSIKTDAQNQNIAEIFVTAVIIVAAVAITVLIGYKIGRTITKAKFKHWTRVKGEIDNKLWNKKPLTKGEWRQYLRADRKLSKINLWSTGTAVGNVVTGNAPGGAVFDVLTNNSNSSVTTEQDWSNDIIIAIRKLIAPTTSDNILQLNR